MLNEKKIYASRQACIRPLVISMFLACAVFFGEISPRNQHFGKSAPEFISLNVIFAVNSLIFFSAFCLAYLRPRIIIKKDEIVFKSGILNSWTLKETTAITKAIITKWTISIFKESKLMQKISLIGIEKNDIVEICSCLQSQHPGLLLENK